MVLVLAPSNRKKEARKRTCFLWDGAGCRAMYLVWEFMMCVLCVLCVCVCVCVRACVRVCVCVKIRFCWEFCSSH